MPGSSVEFELKFLVPRKARAALRAALAERGAKLERQHLVARYFDTADRRLARAGMSLRLRREGGRWVQALKAGAEGALARFEHEVPRPVPTIAVMAHAGSGAGARLAELLADGEPLQQRHGTEIRRTLRRLRTPGARVELAFDEGRITAGDRVLPVAELEFELLSGSPLPMLALAERWRARLGLVVDPRSKAERGDALAEDRAPAGPRRAKPVALRRKVEVAQAWLAVLDECIAQILGNAVALAVPAGVEAAPAGGRRAQSAAPLAQADPADLVHQLRIGLRRLRSATRFFRGWVAPVPETIESGTRELFRALGARRDQDVLAQAIEPALQRAGAPPVPGEGVSPPDMTKRVPVRATAAQAARPREATAPVTGEATQRYLLALLAWRTGLEAAPAAGVPLAPRTVLAPLARRRLRRWQRAIVDQASRFAELDEASRHLLRRRAKRLRYAAGFVETLFPTREMRRFLKRLQAVQDALGELGDLTLAAQHHGRNPAPDPHDWFALGWVAARRELVAAQAGAALAGLARPFARKTKKL